MQEDGDLEALQILEPARSLLDGFDPGVESLTGNIGNAREIGHHIVQTPFQHSSHPRKNLKALLHKIQCKKRVS